MSSDSKSSNGAPAYVRALEMVVDEGLVLAQPGDIGEVLDAGTDGGPRWVIVLFRGAPRATTCILGVEVQPMLALVPAAAEQRAPPAPSPRRWKRRVLAAAVAALAGIVWCASGGRSAREPIAEADGVEVEVGAPGVLAPPPVLADVDSGTAGNSFAGRQLPAPEETPSDWRREPCPKDPRVRVVQERCFLAYGTPPCGVGYEHGSECLIPIAKGKPFPASIRRE